jgi:acyl-CoA synthetase (AMP-forming)/AMP-acid ligase II
MTTFAGSPADTEPGIGALTFGGFLDEVAGRYGEREALVSSIRGRHRISWSYVELRRRARDVAKALVAAGVTRGTRVGLLMSGRPEWVASLWGVLMAGGVAVPFNTFVEPPELDYLLRHSDVSILITQPALLRHRYLDDLLVLCPEIRSAPAPGAICSSTYPFLRRVIALDLDRSPGSGIQGWHSFLGAGARVPDAVIDGIIHETVPAEDAIVIYTSGTTSRPKGVLHMHRAAMIQSWRHGRLEGLTAEDRVYSVFPLFWVTGISFVIGAVLSTGGCNVLTPSFDQRDTLRLVEEERVTVLYCWPYQTAALKERQVQERRDLSSVRRVSGWEHAHHLTGSEPPPELARQPRRQGFGMTETFTYVTAAPVDASPEEMATNGHVLPGNQLRIISRDSGEIFGPGEEGEILIKGPTLMRGYLKTAPELAFDGEGFWHSSDLGWFDEQGWLHFTARVSNVIRTGGTNVSPLEVESALIGHPGISGVAVVGAPDAALDEVVVACVVPLENVILTEDQVRQFLRGKLSTYKIPRRVLFFTEDELPRTASDKFDVAKIRDIATDRLARER